MSSFSALLPFPCLFSLGTPCHILSCPPVSFLFPSFPPFLLPLSLLSPLLSCTLLLSSPPWPMVSLQCSCKGEQTQGLCPHCPCWEHPTNCPCQRHHLSAHSWERECPHFLTGKKKLSDSESRGEVLCIHVHLWHFTVETPFPCPHCWIMNDAAASSSHTVMGAGGKHEEHPPLPLLLTVPETPWDDPSEQPSPKGCSPKQCSVYIFVGRS